MSEKPTINVYTALAAAQAQMGPLIKGAENPHFKSKYADLADLVQAVRVPLNANGLVFFHQIVREEGNQYMRTVLVHGETETRIECDVQLIVAQNNMQGMKSATTYAKRIGLESVTGVAPEDDDGNAAVKAAPKDEPKREDPPFSAGAARDRIKAKIEKAATLDDLVEVWTKENKIVTEIKSVSIPMFAELETAKDARKAALTPKDADLGDDEIPY